jgi:divalent metal cation (Fe/Co/Zn/Cd) transporter
VDAKVDILYSHEIIDQIERDIYNNDGIELTIHLDPIETNDEYTNKIKDVLNSVISKYEGISFHDFRIVRGEKHVNVLFDIVKPFDYELSAKELKESIINQFIEKAKEVDDVEYGLIVEVDNNYLRTEK